MSWEQLISQGKDAAAFRKQDREKPIVECPICGQLLEVRGSIRNCPWGHYRQTGAVRRPESF